MGAIQELDKANSKRPGIPLFSSLRREPFPPRSSPFHHSSASADRLGGDLMAVSEAIENYLETIYILSQQQNEVHAIDICSYLS